MSAIEISLYGAGTLTVLLGIFHVFFYRLFRWKREFQKISVVNARLFYTIHLALTLFILCAGLFAFAAAFEAGYRVHAVQFALVGISLVWLWRLVWQLVYFRARGRYAFLHHALTAYFALLFLGYAYPVFRVQFLS